MTTSIDAAAGPATGVNRFEALQKTAPASQPSGTGRQRALEAAIWPSRPRVAGRQSFAGAVRAEWIKLRTLTSTWVTSAITIVITVLFGAGLAIGYAGSPDRADQAKTMIAAGVCSRRRRSSDRLSPSSSGSSAWRWPTPPPTRS